MIRRVLNAARSHASNYESIAAIFVGAVITAALSFGSTTANAKIYGKIDFGQFAFFQTLVVSIGTVIGYGLGNLGMRIGAQMGKPNQNFDPIELRYLLNIAHFIGITCVIIAIVVQYYLVKFNIIEKIDQNISIPILFSIYFYCMDAVYRSTLLGKGHSTFYSFLPLFGFIPYIIAISLNANIIYVCYGWLLMCITNYITSYFIFRKYIYVFIFGQKKSNNFNQFKIHILDAFPVIISSMLVGPVQWMGNLIILRSSGSYASSAVYVLALQWFTLISFAPNAVARALGPRVTASYFNSSSLELRRHLTKMLYTGVISVIVPCTLVYIYQDSIADMYGKEFAGEMDVVVYAALASAASVIASPVGYLLLATKRLWLGVGLNAVWATVFLIGAAIASHYGVSWVLIGMAIAYIVQALICWVFVAPAVFKIVSDQRSDSRLH